MFTARACPEVVGFQEEVCHERVDSHPGKKTVSSYKEKMDDLLGVGVVGLNDELLPTRRFQFWILLEDTALPNTSLDRPSLPSFFCPLYLRATISQ